MNTFLKSFFVLLFGLLIFSCAKDDNKNITIVPPRDYAEQYATDIENIETFLKTHYMIVTNNPGETDDMDVAYFEITDSDTQTSIWDQTDYPIKTQLVERHDIEYTIYYFKFREGSGSASPCNVDNVLTAYRGEYISTSVNNEISSVSSTLFEENRYPESFFDLSGGIIGWGEILPKFKPGSSFENSDGTTTFTDFGAGVMFLPSGLAYYNNPPATSSIPVYSPLIFNIKLYNISRNDQDGDGIQSYLEDLDGDGYVRILKSGEVNPDDTDGDGIPDFLDDDDDGDYYRTKDEIKNNDTGEAYPFDEIPDCSGNTSDSDRVKRYLDDTCFPPY